MEPLHNHYYSFRHGHSFPNERDQIVSKPEEGRKAENRLTQWGIPKVKETVRDALERNLFDGRRVLIASSPFSRTLQSAMIAQEMIGGKTELEVFDDLRERDFGTLEGYSTMAYLDVWERDRRDPANETREIEPATKVLERMRGVIELLEKTRDEMSILLASHGDPLQILETWFRGIDVSLHRTLKPLTFAEIRPLNP